MTQNREWTRVRAVETCAQSVCKADTLQHSWIRAAAFGVLSVLLWVGCGTVEQCPQGTQEAEDQCLLTSVENEPKFLESADVDAVSNDAQEGGDSSSETWDDTTSGEVDSTSAVNFTAITQKKAPFGCTRHAMGSVPSNIQMKPSSRSEGLADAGEMSEQRNNQPEFTWGLNQVFRNAVQENSLGVALDGGDSSHPVPNRAGEFAGRIGINHDQENVNQCRRGREPRRDCREWAFSQPRIGNPVQGTT